jgi:hypothetical protein
VELLTPLAAEGRTHLTVNGAVTLCGRAITNKWSRRPGDHACRTCENEAATMGSGPPPPGHEAPRAVAGTRQRVRPRTG